MKLPNHNNVFKVWKKGTITQGFDQNGNPTYKADGRAGHGAIDYVKGYGAKVSCDNAGFVYKVFKPGQLDSNWVGVYLLLPTDDPDIWIENGIGHFSKVLVEEGQQIQADTVIGLEGNSGNVWTGGTQITVAQQLAGDTRAHHCHEWYRVVKKVRKAPKYRLRKSNGSSMRDSSGMYYEIQDFDNGYRGNIDPMQFAVHTQTTPSVPQNVPVTSSNPSLDSIPTYKILMAISTRKDFAPFLKPFILVLQKLLTNKV